MSFALDSRLEQSSTHVINLELCQVRLHHNAAFPWILLIPNQAGFFEILELSSTDQLLLMQEIVVASQVLQTVFHPTKLNVAALGNIVPQLHVHIIARYADDAAWPNPVWNSGIHTDYTPEEKTERVTQLQDVFLQKASS
jgi:diadenosine tetraphosphate (Ap4A) HIT family hydrolase